MNRPTTWTSLCVALTLPWAGCGGGGEIALADYPAEFTQMLRGKLAECCPHAEGVDSPTPEIMSMEDAVWRDATAKLQTSIDAGRLVYHADDAFDVRSTLNDMTCAAFVPYFNSGGPLESFFLQPFEGRVPNGGACSSLEAAVCVSQYCEDPCLHGCASNTPTAAALCKAKPGAGAACPASVCADGFYCASTPNSSGPGTCTAIKADGMSCFGAAECASGGCNYSELTTDALGTCGAAMTCDAAQQSP